MHLSAQEAGAYLFLIAHAWEHEGKLPTERVRLARIAHVRQDQWKKVWPALEDFFEITRDGLSISGITHGRVMNELHRLGKISSQRRVAAQQKHSKSNGSAYASTSRSKESSSPNRKRSQPGAYRPSGMSPDKGEDYRSPARAKPDNALQPLPDKPQHAASKRLSEKEVEVSGELKKIVEAKMEKNGENS
jgi:uncharacterized protein YdaU (DUF1376 family)